MFKFKYKVKLIDHVPYEKMLKKIERLVRLSFIDKMN